MPIENSNFVNRERVFFYRSHRACGAVRPVCTITGLPRPPHCKTRGGPALEVQKLSGNRSGPTGRGWLRIAWFGKPEKRHFWRVFGKEGGFIR